MGSLAQSRPLLAVADFDEIRYKNRACLCVTRLTSTRVMIDSLQCHDRFTFTHVHTSPPIQAYYRDQASIIGTSRGQRGLERAAGA